MGIEEQILEMWEQRGIEKGKTSRNTLFAKNLLQHTAFSDERIASLVNVPITFVKAVKENQSIPSGSSCS